MITTIKKKKKKNCLTDTKGLIFDENVRSEFFVQNLMFWILCLKRDKGVYICMGIIIYVYMYGYNHIYMYIYIYTHINLVLKYIYVYERNSNLIY